MKRWIWIWSFLLTAIFSYAASPHVAERVKYKNGPAYIYRLYLTDKKVSPYSISHPNRYLSRRSIERRKRQQLPIDSTDLPVSPRYLRLIEQQDVSIVGQSRWQNTVLVRLKDSTRIHRLEQLACVANSKLVWVAPDSIIPTAQKTTFHEDFEERDSIGGIYHGKNDSQIRLLQGHRLHQIGLTGKNMMIAILDGGFKNVNHINYATINVSDLNRFEDGTVVSPALLKEVGLLTKEYNGLKVLGGGKLERKLTVQAKAFSKSAEKAISDAGGKIEVI